jgi:hypothetical protein
MVTAWELRFIALTDEPRANLFVTKIKYCMNRFMCFKICRKYNYWGFVWERSGTGNIVQKTWRVSVSIVCNSRKYVLGSKVIIGNQFLGFILQYSTYCTSHWCSNKYCISLFFFPCFCSGKSVKTPWFNIKIFCFWSWYLWIRASSFN